MAASSASASALPALASPSSSRSTPTPRNSRIDPRWPPPPMAGSSSPGRASCQEGGVIGVFARRFSSDGTPQAVEFQVNTVTVDEQDAPAVAAADDGGFVIAWASNSQDGFGHGVFARRFDSAGSALGVEFQVNTYTQAAQFHIAASRGARRRFRRRMAELLSGRQLCRRVCPALRLGRVAPSHRVPGQLVYRRLRGRASHRPRR